MNDDGTRYAIGEAARLSGLSVPTVRYYSDAGLVPPAGRTASGYRLYDGESLARLELIRTLRDLGVDLATIGRVLAGAQSLTDVARGQAAALGVQIRTLRLREAVLRNVAEHGADATSIARVHHLVRLSARERDQMVRDLIAEATEGLTMEPGFAARLRSTLPELPADPAAAQIEAWIELAGLIRDPDFRAGVREAFERHAADRASGADGGDTETWRRAERAVVQMAGRAITDGIAPRSPEARPIAEKLVAVFADAHRREDDAGFRTWLAERVRIGADPRVTRYWTLLAIIGGRPAGTDPVPAARWFLAVLEAASDQAQSSGSSRCR